MVSQPKIIAVASGKGGAGKTNVTLNLAWALSRLGHRVCILDADLGLSNVDVLLGIVPQRTLEQVLFERLPLELAITPVATGIDLVPGFSGVARMAELTRAMRTRLVREFSALSGYEYLLVDNSPGISQQVLALCLSAQELVVVVNPEVTSLTDAYALIKVLRGRGLSWPPLVLVNRAPNAQAAELAFRRIQATAQKHLSLNCVSLGHLPEDAAVARAAALQRAVLEAFPQSPFARAVAEAAGRLTRAAGASAGRGKDAASFWDESVRALQRAQEAEPIRQAAPPAPSARIVDSVSSAAPGPAAVSVDAEAQGMMRDMEAVRALFTRLNFKGAPEPLRRIAEAGRGHAENLMAALARIAPGVTPAPGQAGVAPAVARSAIATPAAAGQTVDQTAGAVVTPGAPAQSSAQSPARPSAPPPGATQDATPTPRLTLRTAAGPASGATSDATPAQSPALEQPAASNAAVRHAVVPVAASVAASTPEAAATVATAGGVAVLVRCGNQAMGQILADIVRGLGLEPVFLKDADGAQRAKAAALCLLAAPEASAVLRAWLAGLDGMPVLVLDESFGRGRAVWLAQPGVRTVLPVPFELPELIRNIQALLPGE